MRSFFVLAALVAAVAQASAAHMPHVPHRARHADAAVRELNSTMAARAPVYRLKRKQRCSAPGAGGPKAPQVPPVNVGEKPPASSSTRTAQDDDHSGPTKTQNGAAPSATITSESDPWLLSLSEPLDYGEEEFFTSPKHGDVTFYGQGQTACGDVFDDRTLTAAISRLAFDAWPGCGDGATNRCGICGPFVPGRYFISPADEVVPGWSHAVIGGDGRINCVAGEICHLALTATITNPRNGRKVTVGVVDRCYACGPEDIDLSPAAFLLLTRPDLDLGSLPTNELMLEALKDHDGRIKMDWQFDSDQQYGRIRSV